MMRRHGMRRAVVRTVTLRSVSTSGPTPSSLKPRRPLPPEKLDELFTPAQRSRWPRGYRPTAAPAYFMRRDGVSLKELIDAKADIRMDRRHELQRDLAMDYQLWVRAAYEEFVERLKEDHRRLLKRVLSRASVPGYSELTELFDLPSLLTAQIEPESTLLPGVDSSPQQRVQRMAEEKARTERRGGPMIYPFTSYATTQEFVLTPLQGCRATHDVVLLLDFPMVRNVLHVHHDASSHLRFIAHRSGDDIFLSSELVLELAAYLRERWEALPADADKRRPIMTVFGNGRLAHFLNESGLLPVRVIAQREPTAAIRRQQGTSSGSRRVVDLPGVVKTPASFFTIFPTDDIPLTRALAKHEPSIVIMEPHCERDYTAEARGYYTVREVLMLGRVDGNAMGSFSYPWLSFGVAPSSETYWIYNERFQRAQLPEDRSFMPTDPPYVMQGYDKRYIDCVSRWLVGSNDTPQLPHQYRCISHRRIEIPKAPHGAVSGGGGD